MTTMATIKELDEYIQRVGTEWRKQPDTAVLVMYSILSLEIQRRKLAGVEMCYGLAKKLSDLELVELIKRANEEYEGRFTDQQ